MEETPPKETPAQGLNKIDLSQLQDFQFGTQWTEVKTTPGPRRERERTRESRRDPSDRMGGGEARRDRRSFRRPAGEPAARDPAGTPERGRGGRPAGEGFRRDGFREGRPLRREGPGERRWAGPPRFQRDPRPYQSPYFNVAFYPEDAGFSALVKAMRASCRTFELFEVTRLIIGKYDRFVVVVTRRTPEARTAERADAASGEPGTPPSGTAAPIYVSLPDGMPHETEEEATAHVIGKHLDRFFDLTEVEVEPPKGNFPFVNRCTLSGELLGPPNYHRYPQIVQQHQASRYPQMSPERYREHIETVRDPEVVAQWLEKMKRTTRYTWKPAVEGEEPVAFDNFEDARAHLLANARNRMIKPVESSRFHAKLIEQLPTGEIRRAIEGQLDRQRRFPLDTANALRGRLRREGFTIFKKGAKGISYVCAVKRKFRVPGQTFAESINGLITFLEANPMITMKDLPEKLLGITPPVALGAPPTAAPSISTPPMPVAPAAEEAPASASDASAAGQPPAEVPPPSADAAPPPAAEAPPPVQLTAEEQEKLRRLTMDLHWLVHEGYVTEFADGRLFAPPPMAEARAKTKETPDEDDHDLESFPEAPVAPESDAERPPEAKPADEAGPTAAVSPAPEASTDGSPSASEVPVPAESPVESPTTPESASERTAPAVVGTPETHPVESKPEGPDGPPPASA